VDKNYLQSLDSVDKYFKSIATMGFIWYYICVLVLNKPSNQKLFSTVCG